MFIVLCESCWADMRPRPKIVRTLTKVYDELKCSECGVQPGTLFVETKK